MSMERLVHGGALAAGPLVQRGVVLAADGATNGGVVVLAAVLIGAAHWWLYQLPVTTPSANMTRRTWRA